MIATLLLFSQLAVDTLVDRRQDIDEVVITSSASQGRKRSSKGQVASIDEHLLELSHVSMVRRGTYAWEPTVNNMTTERLSTTIDGMKIFAACTDRMDPVTSYVESGNLQSISLNSGLDGNPQSTGNIGGSLDLKLRRVGFDASPRQVNLSAGFEGNGHLQVYGADAALSSHRAYTNFGLFYRDAGNYQAGGGREVPFSQFHKVNAFANVGYRLADTHTLEASAIFDRATDVGYPALNMDVAVAQGIITSLSLRWQPREGRLSMWETKAYYNRITHKMDDTHRPDVEIHMDMPGRSQTAGVYSLLAVQVPRHEARVNYDLYYNRLFADMTMYPGGAAPMYMVTWPDVGTLCTGVSFDDNYSIAEHHTLHLSAKVVWQHQRLNSQQGRDALSVFFPGMGDAYQQTTGRIAASYRLAWGAALVSVGAGWGSRAPTVTEAYGYYLNNTFDQYDYIGCPHLKNESATELNAAVTLDLGRLRLKGDANVFLFSNYIIGQLEPRLSPMTVDAEGVKVYGNLSKARIANLSLSATWQLLSWLGCDARVDYGLGRDDEGSRLPLIAPFGWHVSARASLGQLQLQAIMKGHARQAHVGSKYGEVAASPWAIACLSTQYDLRRLSLRVGVENLFDRRYATYADWNHIPQKGRNIYASLAFTL